MSSPDQSRKPVPVSSSETSSQNISVCQPTKGAFAPESVQPGSLDDSKMIREALICAIKRSGKTRVAIAEEMQYLLGRPVTEKMLNAFTAESRDDRRWPAEFDRAFCQATGDYSLLIDRVQATGLRVISSEEEKLLDLGREYLRRKRAEQKIKALESDFDGVDL